MLIENSLLQLQPNVEGPFDKEDEIPFGLNVLSNVKILESFPKEGIYHLLGLLLLHDSRGRGHLLPLSLLPLRLGRRKTREPTVLH